MTGFCVSCLRAAQSKRLMELLACLIMVYIQGIYKRVILHQISIQTAVTLHLCSVDMYA